MILTFFTADTHFCHARIIELAKRPFSSTTEMDEAMIRSWNAVVGVNDVVRHVGDFAVTKDADRIRMIFHRLNGSIHLNPGNHCEQSEAVLSLPWASVERQGLIKVGDDEVFLCHYPYKTWPRARKGAIHVYGHMHGRLRGTDRSLDVGVDCWGFKPVLIGDIRKRLKTLPPDPDFRRLAADTDGEDAPAPARM